jgi:hypothetical protein
MWRPVIPPRIAALGYSLCKEFTTCWGKNPSAAALRMNTDQSAVGDIILIDREHFRTI